MIVKSLVTGIAATALVGAAAVGTTVASQTAIPTTGTSTAVAPVVRQVAGPIGRDRVRGRHLLLRALGDEFGLHPRGGEGQRLASLADQAGKQPRGLGVGVLLGLPQAEVERRTP